jgi:hypothetical protein
MPEHAFEKETKQIIDVLRNAHSDIAAISNPEIAPLKARIMTDLRRHENSLCMQLGQEIELVEQDAVIQVKSSGPITKLFGKEIKPISRNEKLVVDETKPVTPTPAIEIKTTQEIELQELRVQRDEVYNKFLTAQTDDLLDSLDELVIRAVAKRAGLPVTETNPKRVDAKFIDRIKAAIKKQNELAAKGEVGNADETASNEPDDQ